ncbi:hypothetical protein [Aureimonas sp. AU40]|uniref:hypothetical protein n=1 Tax=Aureimonas sp. AU40 TaxID=1637747 RepID=UPI000784D656|nr:hypothetical protein [Aureimonas sp. AU40]
MNTQSPVLAVGGPVSALPKTDPRFPPVSDVPIPLGHRLVVQHAKVSQTYAGTSIIKHVAQVEAEAYQCTEAKVLKVGDDAWRNRETGVEWVGGAKLRPGDVVLIPMTKGLRFTRDDCTLQMIEDIVPLALLERPSA